MYRPSPVRNPRSKGIKSKNVLQVCLLLAVCFWLIFQVKRSHEKKKEFDNTKKEFDYTKISLSTSKQSNDETAKFGRKDLQPKLEKEAEIHEEHQEHEEQDEQEHEEQDEEKIDEGKDDEIDEGKDDEIDENEQEKSEVEVDQEEIIEEVIDEESESKTENGVSVEDHAEEEEEEDGASIHTHEGREEHYKADDASSAVVTDLANENATNEEISNGENVNNGTSLIDSHENGPPSSTTIMNSDSTEALNVTGEGFVPNQTEGSSNSSYVKSDELNSSNDGLKPEVETDEENLEGNDVILDPDEVENETHLEEKEVRMDLDTLPEIETEGGNSEDTAAERR